LVISEFNK